MADSTLITDTQNTSLQNVEAQTLKPVSAAVLTNIEKKLSDWRKMANLLQVSLVILGASAIACSLFITAFAGSDFLGSNNNTTIRIFAFITTLFLTLITSFNLSSKANNCRNAWRHLNKAMYSYKSKIIDGDTLINAYEEGENILGSVDYNFNNNKENSNRIS